MATPGSPASPARTRARRQTSPTGRRHEDKAMIPDNIDPEGNYNAPLPGLRAQVPPWPAAAVIPAPADDNLALNTLILQGDQVFHHRRSSEEPPPRFVEDETESEESDEG